MYNTIKNLLKLNNRTLQLAKNVVGSLLSRVINLGSTLIIVPLAIKGLGTHDYGIFAVILSTVILFSYSDLGLGLAIVNKVASANTDKSIAEARDAISNVWQLLLRISATIFILGISIIAIYTINYNNKFEWQSWLVLIGCIAAGLAPGLTQRILFGLQKNFEANLWNTGGKTLSVVGVYFAYLLKATMPWFIFSMVGLTAIIGWINTLVLWRNTPNLRPMHSKVSWHKLNDYTRIGFQFLFLQLGVFFETGIDNILIGSAQGTHAVTNYDLMARLFNYVPALISMMAFPIWPAVNQAKAQGDFKWVEKIRKFSFIGTALISTIVSAIILYFHTEIINAWIGMKYTPNFGLAIALSAFSILASLGMLQSTFMNGMGLISVQVRVLAIYLLAIVPGKYLMLNFSGQILMVWVLVVFDSLRIFYLWRISRIKG